MKNVVTSLCFIDKAEWNSHTKIKHNIQRNAAHRNTTTHTEKEVQTDITKLFNAVGARKVSMP